MSNQDFDQLSRSLAGNVSRRKALKLLAGGVLGAAGTALFGQKEAEALAECQPLGSQCFRHEHCCSEYCIGTNGGPLLCTCKPSLMHCSHHDQCCSGDCREGSCK